MIFDFKRIFCKVISCKRRKFSHLITFPQSPTSVFSFFPLLPVVPSVKDFDVSYICGSFFESYAYFKILAFRFVIHSNKITLFSPVRSNLYGSFRQVSFAYMMNGKCCFRRFRRFDFKADHICSCFRENIFFEYSCIPCSRCIYRNNSFHIFSAFFNSYIAGFRFIFKCVPIITFAVNNFQVKGFYF